ncbi:hypothetical protein [Engelhardtia mirabilis]|uniref:Nickel uptake substrate-specific transmembrane region n=1 Tax=Engelhardtia mirabilis TaxID=2528011 RepID=A0A518BG13_9BACT|nr:hypothetical protein Pla133_09900 [Planctomycetes bacterium Pla133]QDV00250.1 hypothetical protein Pla86_09890 [Planctomycetes bacterium Pla86]
MHRLHPGQRGLTRSIVPVFVAVALVVAALILFDRNTGSNRAALPTVPPAPSFTATTETEGAMAELDLVPDGTTAARVEAAQAAAGVETLLAIRVIDGFGAPLAGASVRVNLNEQVDSELAPPAAGRGAVEKDLIVGSDGLVLVEVPPDQRLLVSAKGPEGAYYRPNQSTWLTLSPGETREVELVVERPSGTFHGLVVDAVNGQPLAGVSIRPVPPRRRGSATGPAVAASGDADAGVTRSDSAGRFTFDLAKFGDGSATATTAERVPVRFRVDEDGLDPERPLLIRMQLAATLVGTIRGLDEPATITATCAAHHLRVRGEANNNGGDLVWQAPVDAVDGSFELAGLLPEKPLQIELRAGREVLQRTPQDLVLKPGERRELNWSVESGATVRVTAVDGTGVPQSGVLVHLYPGSASWQVELAPRQADPLDSGSTDASGVVEFHGVQPGRWCVAPKSLPGIADESAIAPQLTRVDVDPGDSEVEARVVVHRGEWIAGRAVDHEGEPIGGFTVIASKIGGEAGAHFSVAKQDGTFRIGPLLPGLWRVQAWRQISSGFTAPPDPLDLPTGTTDALLQFRVGAQLSAILVDPITGEQLAGDLWLEAGPLDFRHGNAQRSQPTGFGGLVPGTYQLSGIADDGRLGVVRGLQSRAGETLETIEVPVAPGGEVRVHYEGPQETAVVYIEQDGVSFTFDSVRSGTNKLLAAPLGQVTVRFSRYLGGLDESGEPRRLVHEETVQVREGEVAEAVLLVEDD